MTPEIKKILNSLSCPICGAQIDIIKNYYGCVANHDHYYLYISTSYDWTTNTNSVAPNQIYKEVVSIYADKYKYVIEKMYSYVNNNIDVVTYILVYEIDQEGRMIFSFKDKTLKLDFGAFDFKNFNVEKALSRIKTLFVFQ
jgi:hypothetical protein